MSEPFHNPFGALAGLVKGAAGESGKTAASEPAPAPAPTSATNSRATTLARAVVRYERAGRRGKDVTVVEQLTLTPAERGAWLKALKAALGCGGAVEGETLMLQGDHRTRLPALLTARGVGKVIVG